MTITKVKINKDGRMRAYYKDSNGKDKLISYPKLIMEEYLGRKLLDNEIVHHIDGNPLNNDISNLQVLTYEEHNRLHFKSYYDKEAICEVCGRPFIWTAERQSLYQKDFNQNKNRIITCSKSCSSLYGRYIQLGYNEHEALELSKNRKR